MVLASKYASCRKLGVNQLLRAIKQKAVHAVNGEEPSRYLAEEVVKATTMRQSRGSAEGMLEALTTTLENILLAESSSGGPIYAARQKPDLAEHISSAFVAGCSPTGFQNFGKSEPKYVSKWKEDLSGCSRS